MNLGLDGRRALVSGASRGLGFAAARCLAAEGAVVAISSSTSAIHDAADEIAGDARPYVVDVSDPDRARAWVEEAGEDLGGVDILVTNAGGPPPARAVEATIDDYRRALDLNCFSAIAMCQAATEALRSSDQGRVVAITSIAVRQPPTDLAASAVARSALTSYLKLMARELGPDGVTVNSIQPGFHATARLRELGHGDLADRIPMRRLGDPDDFGALVTMLCSRQAGFISGAAIPVDGGAYPGLF